MDNNLYIHLMTQLLYTQALCAVLLENQIEISKSLKLYGGSKESIMQDVQEKFRELKIEHNL